MAVFTVGYSLLITQLGLEAGVTVVMLVGLLPWCLASRLPEEANEEVPLLEGGNVG